MTTTINVDLRELSGLAVDAPIEDGWLSIALSEVIHVETGGDYLLTQNEYEVQTINGVASFEAPVTGAGQALRVRENGWRGARTKYLIIPASPDPSNYGDLVEVSKDDLVSPIDPPSPGWFVPVGGTAGQSLSKVDGTDRNVSWQSKVAGPATAVDNTLPRYDGTTGQLLQGSGITVDDDDDITLPEVSDITVGTTTGSKIGTSSTQKLGFWGATPVGRPSAVTDLGTVLSDIGLRSAGTSYPITTDGLATLTGSQRTSAQVRTAGAAYATGATPMVNLVDATSGSNTQTLPGTTTPGHLFLIIKTDSSANTVTVAGTINGATNHVLRTRYQFVMVMSTTVSGSWITIAESSGVQDLSGSGSPEGVVAAPVGSTYTDTAVTNGAAIWRKNTGTGNTGWKVIAGDTGWRSFTGTDLPADWRGTNSAVFIRRTNENVHFAFSVVPTVATPPDPASGAFFSVPTGFQLTGTPLISGSVHDFTGYAEVGGVPSLAVIRIGASNISVLMGTRLVDGFTFVRGAGMFSTLNNWPTGSLPGTAL